MAPEPLVEDLLVDLIEHPTRTITARDLQRWGGAGAALLRWGALRRGETLTSIACDACDDDHFVELEFDTATGNWCYYCAAAGLRQVDPDDLITYGFDLHWLAERLANLLSVQRLEMACLIEGIMWRLGVARLGTTFWTAVLVRDVDQHLNQILERVALAGRSHPGLLMSSSQAVPPRVALRNDYRWLPLRQLLRVDGDDLHVYETAIEDALRTRNQRRSDNGKRGRPGDSALILKELRCRAATGEMLDTIAAEARHLAAWLAQRPRLIVHSSGTVENTIREAFNELKSNRPRTTN